MFEEGDLVIYEKTGVCRIDKITTQNSSGLANDQLFYILHPLHDNCIISVPVGSDQLYMRNIITREKAEELIDHYQESLDSYDCGNQRRER